MNRPTIFMPCISILASVLGGCASEAPTETAPVELAERTWSISCSNRTAMRFADGFVGISGGGEPYSYEHASYRKSGDDWIVTTPLSETRYALKAGRLVVAAYSADGVQFKPPTISYGNCGHGGDLAWAPAQRGDGALDPGTSAILTAISAKDAAALRKLLDKHPDLGRLPPMDGGSALKLITSWASVSTPAIYRLVMGAQGVSVSDDPKASYVLAGMPWVRRISLPSWMQGVFSANACNLSTMTVGPDSSVSRVGREVASDQRSTGVFVSGNRVAVVWREADREEVGNTEIWEIEPDGTADMLAYFMPTGAPGVGSGDVRYRRCGQPVGWPQVAAPDDAAVASGPIADGAAAASPDDASAVSESLPRTLGN